MRLRNVCERCFTFDPQAAAKSLQTSESFVARITDRGAIFAANFDSSRKTIGVSDPSRKALRIFGPFRAFEVKK
jgi:hypothetical protein